MFICETKLVQSGVTAVFQT